MSQHPRGELVPVGGGDNIPLIRDHLTLGRRESCDICLHLPNISGLHCEFTFSDGIWSVRDLNSTNGVKVNDERIISKKRLNSGDRITIAKRTYTIEYSQPDGPVSQDDADDVAEILKHSLLERAGLEKPRGK